MATTSSFVEDQTLRNSFCFLTLASTLALRSLCFVHQGSFCANAAGLI